MHFLLLVWAVDCRDKFKPLRIIEYGLSSSIFLTVAVLPSIPEVDKADEEDPLAKCHEATRGHLHSARVDGYAVVTPYCQDLRH